MNKNDRIDPSIQAILDSANRRETSNDKVKVAPRMLSKAFEKTKARKQIPIIAEIKPTSPTTERVREEDPVEVAIAMVEGGATALSVLTEPEFFKGSIEALERVRAAVDIPVLRKDFILKESHLDAVESDLILIIASFVDNLEELYYSAKERGFQVLLEVHCEKEIEIAVSMGAEIIGINNRNIKNLEVNLETFEKLADKVPDKTILIAESGISNENDAMRMYNAGADGLLIGTAIMEGKIKQNTERFTQIKI